MKYFFAFLATVGLIIIVIVLLLSGGGSKKSSNSTPTPVVKKTLTDYANTSAQVRLTTQGQINADSLHEQTEIFVGQEQVVFNHIAGYNGRIIGSQSYANTQSAYYAFLRALQLAGFSNVSNDPATEQSRCPLGRRFILSVEQDGKELQRSWVTSCGGPKTYLGNINLTLTLFYRQVPDYNTLMQDVRL